MDAPMIPPPTMIVSKLFTKLFYQEFSRSKVRDALTRAGCDLISRWRQSKLERVDEFNRQQLCLLREILSSSVVRVLQSFASLIDKSSYFFDHFLLR